MNTYYMAGYDIETERCIHGVRSIVKQHIKYKAPATFFVLGELLEDNDWDGRSAKEFYSIINTGSISVLEITDAAYFNSMLDNTAHFFDINDIPTNVKASEHITKILTYLIEQKFDKPKNKMISQKKVDIEKTIEYMRKNYKDKISVDELAKNAMISKYYFIKLFKSVYGTGPYCYLLNIRISIAKNLLVTTDMSIKDIAFEAGFSNCNNFIKAFKKITGMSPLEYKKSL